MPRLMHRNYPPITASEDQVAELVKVGWYTAKTGPLPLPIANVEKPATIASQEAKRKPGRPRRG